MWTERHLFHEGNLTIKRLLPADMGIYQCFVNNKHGQMHADIELNVSGNTSSLTLKQGAQGDLSFGRFLV